jgi:hypothetical protein
MRLRRKRERDVEVDAGARVARAGGVSASVRDPALLEEAAELVRWLLAHPGFTAGHYGFWPIAVVDGRVHERDEAHERWVEGAERAVRIHALQEQTCWDLASAFEPPVAEATAVVAPGALAGESVELVRFEHLAPQSGWFVGGSDGDRVPLHAVVRERPELVDYLALEPGWTVRVESEGARVRRREV